MGRRRSIARFWSGLARHWDLVQWHDNIGDTALGTLGGIMAVRRDDGATGANIRKSMLVWRSSSVYQRWNIFVQSDRSMTARGRNPTSLRHISPLFTNYSKGHDVRLVLPLHASLQVTFEFHWNGPWRTSGAFVDPVSQWGHMQLYEPKCCDPFWVAVGSWEKDRAANGDK